MSELMKARALQYEGSIVFAFNFDDTMDNTSGVSKDFGKTTVAETNTFAIGPIPKGAVVTGGSVSRSVAFDTAGLDITVGDTASTNRYLASADLKATGFTSLTPSGYVSDGEDLVITVQCDDVCTTGKCVVAINYVRPGFVSEVAL